MEHTKETLSALVREMQSVTACNRGVYILNIEIFLTSTVIRYCVPGLSFIYWWKLERQNL